MELRPYQQEARQAVEDQWKEVDRTLLVLPTGCGKTIVFAKIAEDCVRSGQRPTRAAWAPGTGWYWAASRP